MGTLAQVKQHDYGLPLIVDLNYRETDLDIANIADAVTLATDVVFIMTLEGATVPTINRAAASIYDIDSDAGTITVSYQWVSGDTDTAGRYRAEFEFDLTDGPETAPTGGYIIIDIVPDLG